MSYANTPAATAYPEAQGFMWTQPDADDIRVALEAVTGDDYTDTDLATMAAITRQRIAEMQPEANQEGLDSAAGFEVVMLKELLTMMTGQPVNVTLH